MGKNDLAARIQKAKDTAYLRGMEIGMQFEHDMIHVVLHTKEGWASTGQSASTMAWTASKTTTPTR